VHNPSVVVLDPQWTVDHIDDDIGWVKSIPFTRPSGCSFESQGITPGYADLYDADLSGQYVPLAGVANGTYALLNEVNPLGNLLETTRTDNTAFVRVRIEDAPGGGRRAVVV
jgi:hypothetical protein